MNSNRWGQLRFDSLFFDFDGTLVDSLPGIAYSLEQAFKARRRAMLTPLSRTMIGPPVPTIVAQLLGSTDAAEIGALVSAFRASYDFDGWTKTEVFADVKDTLQSLADAGTRLYVFTNKPAEITAKIVHRCGLQGLLQEVRSKDSRVPQYTSKTEMLQDMMGRHHIDHRHSAVVGDSHEDLDAARMLNQEFFFASYGYGNVEFTAVNQMTIIPNFGDLLGHCIGVL